MNRFPKWLLLGSSLATLVTGVVYGWMKYFMEPVSEWAAVNHPLQPLVLKAHIVVSPLLVFAVGLIAVGHIWRHYRSGTRLGRRSGLVMMWLVGPMILTGYLIQAVTQEGWLAAMVWGHLVTGGIYGVAILVHWAVSARRRRTGAGRARGRPGGATTPPLGTPRDPATPRAAPARPGGPPEDRARP